MDQRSSKKREKVFISMSGGVDSAVAALLLKKQGFDCIGVSMLMMGEISKEIDDEKVTVSGKDLLFGCHIDDLDKIQELCEHIEIPFYAIDAKALFSDLVVEKVLASRLSGEVSSPCVVCNEVKLKMLLKKADEMEIDHIATGHYAKIYYNKESNEYQVTSGNDHENDQSHLLCSLEQDVLKRLILPIGELKRDEVEKLKNKFHLNCVEKPNRGKTCFHKCPKLPLLIDCLAAESFRSEGNFTNIDTDSYVGEHPGIHHHFLGQDSLATTTPNATIEKNLTVVEIRPEKSEIMVGSKDRLEYTACNFNHFRKINEFDVSRPRKVFVRPVESDKRIEAFFVLKNNRSGNIFFTEKMTGIIPGEHIVFYNRPGKSGKLLGSAQINYLGDIKNIHRAHSIEQRPVDDDGNEMELVGDEYSF